jgi:ABC-type amino acid transport substrate-binding protein
MKKLSLILLMVSFMAARSQNADSLTVNYYENYPYAYTESGKLQGIEVDIIEEYVAWMKQKKNVTVVVSYKAYKEFSAFYTSVKDGRPNVIGLGSVTNNTEREKEVMFSAPYLRNVAVLITDGGIATIKSKTQADVLAVLGGLNGFAVSKSSHAEYMNELKKAYLPSLKITYTETQNSVLEAIAGNAKNFGYVDIVAYWAYLKKNPSKYLKMQKAFSESNQFFEFILPKKTTHINSINEFFEGGFGFTSTKKYSQILEKYLGYEIIESVEIK